MNYQFGPTKFDPQFIQAVRDIGISLDAAIQAFASFHEAVQQGLHTRLSRTPKARRYLRRMARQQGLRWDNIK